MPYASPQPRRINPPVCPLPRSLATTSGISVDFSSSPYLEFRRFPTYAYLIQRTLTEYCSAGFPHSEIPGSKLMCSSPRLIAACHVLHRLSMPRHSPCALSSLTYRFLPETLVLLELCRLQIRFIVVCVTHLKVPQLKLCYLSVACSQFLACFTVQFSRYRF